MAKPKAPETFLYTLATGAESYIITKWDSIGFEQLSQYIMPFAFDEGGDREIGCTCPQGLKPSCRHRKMLPRILLILDVQGWVYRYGDDRFFLFEEGKMRAATEKEQYALEGREPHPLSAEQHATDSDGLEVEQEDELLAPYKDSEDHQLATNPNELLPSDKPLTRRGL